MHMYTYIYIYTNILCIYTIHLHTLRAASEVTSLCMTPETVECDGYVAYNSGGVGGEKWGFPKNRGKTPKMDGGNHGKPY